MGNDLPKVSNPVSGDTQVPASDTCEDENQDEDEMLSRAIDLSLRNDDAPVCEPPLESNFENYQYSPLPSTDKTIRLLRIPPADHFSDPLVCQMHQVRLIDKPEYAALSYSWGAPIFDHHVICNGRRLAITAHLDAALRRFRTTTWEMLWVDALCIDQTNIPERNYQVSIMKHIYSQALRTFVYLGESCLLDSEALKLMISLTELAPILEEYSSAQLENIKPLNVATFRARDEAIRFIGLKNAGFPGTITRNTDLLSAGLPHPQHPAWEAMQALFSRPWFSRMWIIQEVVLSPDVVVMLGRYHFSWKLVTDCVRAYRGLGLGLWHATLPQDATVEQSFIKSADSVLDLLHVTNDSQCRCLIKLLSSFRNCHSSDLRDKVYALLGLANDQRAHQMVSIDYSKSIEAVYMKCAEFLVMNGDGMEMLLQAGIPQKRDGTCVKVSVPSWVPDWSLEMPHHINQRQKLYRAARETQSDMGFKDCGIGLNVKGIRIDVIDALAPVPNADENGSFLANDLISWEQKVREVAQQSRFFSGERAGDYANALSVGSYYSADDNNGYISVDCLLDVLRNRKSSELSKSHEQYIGHLGTAAQDEKFCVTREGYMDWVPLSSQLGDFIVVLYGGPLPFTVRETNGKYVLLGAGYLEGFMNGEALRLEDAGPEEFVLE